MQSSSARTPIGEQNVGDYFRVVLATEIQCTVPDRRPRRIPNGYQPGRVELDS